jgi:translocation and assembly module TamB
MRLHRRARRWCVPQPVGILKRLSDRLYVSYEQGLGDAVSNLVKLDYALGKRWSLRAESGTTSGAGLFYRFSWD